MRLSRTLRLVGSATGVVLACGWLAGSALADATPTTSPGQTVESNSSQDVTTSGEGSVSQTGTTSVSSTTTDGTTPTSVATVTPPDNPTTVTAVTAVVADNATVTPQQTTGTGSGTGSSTTPVSTVAPAATPPASPTVLANTTPSAAVTRLVAIEQTKGVTAVLTTVGTMAPLPAPVIATPTKDRPAPPARPSGVVTELSALLTQLIVPIAGAVKLALPANSLSVLLIPVLLTFSLLGWASPRYASLLRRSGYAHAARSDVPGSIFATPLLMGYSSPAPAGPRGGPFLVGSDIKTQAKQLITPL